MERVFEQGIGISGLWKNHLYEWPLRGLVILNEGAGDSPMNTLDLGLAHRASPVHGIYLSYTHNRMPARF